MAQQGLATRVYLADLTIQPAKVAVCVRVIRRWTFNGNEPGAAVRYIGLVLADEKGDSMYAEIPRPHVQRLGPLVQASGIYIISKFTVRTSKSGYIPFERKHMIEFNAYTTVKEAADPPATFPMFIYRLTPFSNINPFGAAANKLIDILGIVCSVEAPKPLPLPKKERVATIREIIIRNENNEELKVTLWDDRATDFSLPASSESQAVHSIVVLFVGCQPATLHKVVQAYGGSACHWYFNPDIREAQPLYNRLKLSPIPVCTPPPQLTSADKAAEPILIEHKTLAQLNETDPYEIPKVGYKCTVTITEIHQTPRWWYVGCAKCGKAPEVETVPFLCRCGWKESATLYKLGFQAKDDTGEARFFCYDTVSRRIIKRNIAFMLRQSRESSGLPQHFKELISKKYTFIVGVTSSSFHDPNLRTYLVKTIAVDYHEQAYIANQLQIAEASNQSAGSSSSVSIIPQIAAPPNVTTQTHIVIDSSVPVGALTPPPSQPMDETPTKDNPENFVHGRSSVARPLFPSAGSKQKNHDVTEKMVSLHKESHKSDQLQITNIQSGSDPSGTHDTTHSAPNAVETQNEVDLQDEMRPDVCEKPKEAEKTASSTYHGTKRSRPNDSVTKPKENTDKLPPSKGCQ